MTRYGDGGSANQLRESIGSFMRRCLFRLLSVGPIPNHLAFIMDGNRRYSKKKQLEEGAGHKDGFRSLMSMLKFCYELGVKYVTIYAFSIENFKRQPSEVQNLMDLLLEKINGLLEQQSIVNHFGIRVYFIGNLELLSEPVRVAAEKVMTVTAANNKAVLLVCLAYTSGDEIVHAIQYSCERRLAEIQATDANKIFNNLRNVPHEGESGPPKTDTGSNGKYESPASEACRSSNGDTGGTDLAWKMRGEHCKINLVDIAEHMYMAIAPDPEVLIRSSGETRLSNFLLWQTKTCLLYSPAVLWPEIGLRHLVWAVLNFQRNYAYLEKKNKQS